ncbi:phosphoribosylaminoimidazolesuccinocarboxamide synthase [Microlunatus speluncae]|uniref:phosphoribosylaminoimidazolesuccinocarboxamide synthase n=1 Tax=Microlunatus speluncae TaxID=2594267 RepID=UPI0012668909|nr:phosphoribosylaminoimidazolesuccinocarboxamide synthase [Microlunatus speluncae]
MELIRRGKVREVYADGEDVILVASDRVSIYDVVLPTPIPDKGAILTQLSLWWFRQFADLVPNHVISEDVPEEWRGRAIRCRRLEIIPIECIARGYLSGSGLVSYRESGTVSGIALPPGLDEADRLPEPIFTPTTKEEEGHDQPMTRADAVALIGEQAAADLERLTVELYTRGAELARERGVIIADTKFEFGLDPAGVLTLGDEVLTPDSSRFWQASTYERGRVQDSYDKQVVRNWSASLDWDRTYPGPEIPDEIAALTRSRYLAIYEQLTGQTWPGALTSA